MKSYDEGYAAGVKDERERTAKLIETDADRRTRFDGAEHWITAWYHASLRELAALVRSGESG